VLDADRPSLGEHEQVCDLPDRLLREATVSRESMP
jgi:hypothetical protein